MKKLVVSLAVAIIAALLGVGGWVLFKGAGPRERVEGGNGTKVIVEELSYYNRGRKVYGKVFKPSDENGNFPDSLGTRPVVIYFHESLSTAAPEKMLRQIAARGVVGYSAAFHDKKSEIGFLVKKIGRERFADKDLIFLLTDGAADKAADALASRRRGGVAGHLVIDPADPAVLQQVTEFLEMGGAMK